MPTPYGKDALIMFTGIIEEIGIIKEKSTQSMSIQAQKVLDDLKPGDSVAINGVCLTVTWIGSGIFKVGVMPETLKLTNLGQMQVGNQLNLERALRFDSRLGGHLVSGHIDGPGRIVNKIRDTNSLSLDISTSRDILRYIIKKGSIAIDGLSLTVAEVWETGFNVCLIPHTLKLTTLGNKEIGDSVNLEVDVIGKYVEKLVNKKQGIDLGFLAEHGFA